MLEKPEEKEFHKKWESLYVFTGRRSDLTTMISIAVINPMILYVFIGYVAGKRISLPVLYLAIYTSKRTAREKNSSGSIYPGDTRFFPHMKRGSGKPDQIRLPTKATLSFFSLNLALSRA